MFLLNAEVYGGIGLSYSYMLRKRFWEQQAAKDAVKDKDDIDDKRGHFLGGQLLAGYNLDFKNVILGLQVYVGSPFLKLAKEDFFKPQFYGGGKVVIGFRILRSLHLYGGIGYEIDRVENRKPLLSDTLKIVAKEGEDFTWHGHLTLSGDVDFYFNPYIGCGLNVSYRFPKDTGASLNILKGNKEGKKEWFKAYEVDARTINHFRIMVKLMFKNSGM